MIATAAAAPLRLIAMIRRAAAPLTRQARLIATQRRLEALDDHILKDIGLQRSQIRCALRRQPYTNRPNS
jgi:uncharacterized protein YjiS (DUF1127 family)